MKVKEESEKVDLKLNIQKTKITASISLVPSLHGCESWTKKKAEHRRIDVFELGFGEDS